MMSYGRIAWSQAVVPCRLPKNFLPTAQAKQLILHIQNGVLLLARKQVFLGRR